MHARRRPGYTDRMATKAAVLCDVDGTLVDTTYLHTICWWQALRERGHIVPMIDIRAAVGMGADRLLPHVLGRELDDKESSALSDGHDDRFRAYWDQLVPTTGASAFVRASAAEGLTVVLASSAATEELGALRRAIDAEDAIAGATSADDVSSSKPAPDLVHRALELAGVSPHDAVFVGDTVWDVEAAHQAGVPCVGLACGGTTQPELRAAGADAVYRDPAELLAGIDSSPLARLRQ
jgi:HAD superfamily hydrolase (TIGR01509 family)